MPLLQTPNLRLESKEAGVALLLLDVADRPINVIHRQLLDELEQALGQVASDRSLRALLIAGGKRSGFLAGADVRELAAIQSAEEAAVFSARGQRLFAQLEGLAAVSVALIHGPCLGGGLELALACDYRLVIDHSKTQFGLPEVELGLLPAWGGTQRLPRVIGIEPALRIILAGRRLLADEAVRLHLADQLLSSQSVEEAIPRAIAFAAGKSKRPRSALPRRGWRQVLLEGNPVGRRLLFRAARRSLRQRVPDDMPAPWEALEAIRTGITQGIGPGLAFEREAVGRLATSPACRNLVRLFLAREEARKLPAEMKQRARPIKKVGIVGGGTMGAGIAQLAALRDCQVVIQEANAEALGAASLRIAELLRQAKDKRAIHTVEMVRALGAIRGTLDWKGFDDVDLAIEAVVEDTDAKRQVFADLEQHTRPDAILATNTSSLLVAKMQEGRQHPGRVAGLHFFHPVHKMPLVEVVRGPRTEESTIASLMQWSIDAGKTPVAVKDSPGFVVNRILMPYLQEAVSFWLQGIDRVDRLMRRFGMPLGPFELLDQVGIDVAANIERAMKPERKDSVLQRMKEKGLLGMKSGEGFYKYVSKWKYQNSSLPWKLYSLSFRHLTLPCTDDEIWKSLAFIAVNESARVLSDGIAADAQAIDLAMVLGAGWAPHRGGPLRYADDWGLKEVVKTMNDLAGAYSEFGQHLDHFAPCPELAQRAESGERFYPGA